MANLELSNMAEQMAKQFLGDSPAMQWLCNSKAIVKKSLVIVKQQLVNDKAF